VLTIGDIGVVGGMIHLGDEAMFEVAVTELAARGGEVIGISSAPEESAERYRIRAAPRLGFVGLSRSEALRRRAELLAAVAGEAELSSADPATGVLRALDEASGVLIAGGGNLASRWPVHVFERTTLAALAVAQGIPVVLTGQTLGPDLEPDDEERVAATVRAAALTGVREFDSARLVREWRASVRVGVDDASFLGDGAGDSGDVDQHDAVLVSLSGWLAGREAGAVAENLARLLDRAADDLGPVVFHAHYGAVDPAAPPAGDALLHERVRERMRRPSRVVPVGDARGAARLARGARALVTGRYHPAVFAAPAGVPIVALAADDYTRVKLGGALGHWGQDTVVDIGGSEADAALARAVSAHEAIAAGAAERSAAHRAASAQWWDDVASALTPRGR
jgi:polysaccharide pyruvyl transferase WcaK-like protein